MTNQKDLPLRRLELPEEGRTRRTGMASYVFAVKLLITSPSTVQGDKLIVGAAIAKDTGPTIAFGHPSLFSDGVASVSRQALTKKSTVQCMKVAETVASEGP